jgi:hypothetical protein
MSTQHVQAAVNWLLNHGQEVTATTETGVCVVDVSTRLDPASNAYEVEVINVWLPARLGALRDFMNY